MAKAQDFTAFFKDLPAAFPVDEAAFKDAWTKTAKFNEQFAGIALDAANKAGAVSEKAAAATLAGLRTVTKARSDAKDYVNAVVEFGNAQAALVKESVETLTEALKQAQTEATELFMSAGKQAAEEVNKTATKAQTQVTAAVKKATEAAA